ncbi:protein SCAR2 isoform X2 [Arachis hypogaea]|uniref:protein SCAR2 isoform X2 n=1 Tax=Arachis hypogaea TaxID=3818 RepID=UPI000DEC3838|nr:protein SCAR2 isoform X2 [Arachis hypogaea]
MPLSKYHIRNEYGLADPELYRAADVRDDPEALLEAVAMGGLVGLLRQLGDLAEFAAEIFHDLHEEVMATAARGHGLMTRVQQLEAEVPSLEKAFFSQTHHSSFYTNGGVDWHPNLRSEQNLVTQGDLPRFIMDSYEECRGPPRLFLLDKFDVAGAGACLKRYTDPSFFKMESASFETKMVEVHREKRIRKIKKKGQRLRDGEGPNVAPSHAKLHQLLLEERIENGYTDPARLVKLKKRQLSGSAVEVKDGKSYMTKFLETASPDHKMIYETSIIPLSVKPMSDDTSEAGIKMLEISGTSPVKRRLGNENTYPSPNQQESELKGFSEMDGKANGDVVKVKEQKFSRVTDEISSNHPKFPMETELAVDEQKKIEGILDGYHSDTISEVDNYMDALNTMESELETDNECKPKRRLLNIQKATDGDGKENYQPEARFSYSQSFGDSSTSDEIGSFKQDRNEEQIEEHAQLSDSRSTGTSSMSDNSLFRRDGDDHTEMQSHFSDSPSIGNSSMSDDNSSSKKERSPSHHTDSLSSVVENIQSEPILLTKTKIYEPEVEDTLPRQPPHIVVHDAPDGEEEISDSGQASNELMTSGHVLCSVHGPASPVTLPPQAQSDELPFDPVELNSTVEEDEERTDRMKSMVAEPVSLYAVKEDACPLDLSDKNSLDKLDNYDPNVQSDDLLQFSNNLELVQENEGSDLSEIKKLQVESPNKNSLEVLVDRDIGSTGEDPISSSMEELDLNSGTMAVLDCQDLKDEDCIISTQLGSEDLAPVVDVPPMSCLTGELSSDVTHNNPQDEPSLAKNEQVCSDVESISEEGLVPGDEIRSTSGVDPVEGDGHVKELSSPDTPVMVNDVFSENVDSEDQAVSTVPSVNSDDKDAGILTCPAPSGSSSSLQKPLSSSLDYYKMEMESNEVKSTQILKDLNVEKMDSQLEQLTAISPLDVIYSPTINCTDTEECLSAVADPHEKEMEVNKAVARESLTELERQNEMDQPIASSAGVQLNLEKQGPGDLSNLERCNDNQNSSPWEKLQHSASVDDMKMVQEFSGLDSQQSESIFDDLNDPSQNKRESFSSPFNKLESGSDVELFSRSHGGEWDAEFMLSGEGNIASEKTQLEKESIHATPDFPSDDHADELSSSHPLPQSSSQEVNPTEHVMEPSKSLPDLFTESAENNLDEMPPMPPLPPMQWRMGKVQHSSPFLQREQVEVNQASFQPMLPSGQPMLPIEPDNTAQFGFPTSERDNLLSQNPFVPVMAVSDKLQSSGFPVGVSGHPVAIPFQFPIMVNEANGQYLLLDRSQIANPFYTLPVVTTSRPQHGYIVASEGLMAQNSTLYPPTPSADFSASVTDFTSPQEKLTQSPSQLMTETSLEVKAHEHPIRNDVPVATSQDSHVTSGQDSISADEQTQPLILSKTETSEDDSLQQSTDNRLSAESPPHAYVVASEGETVESSDPCPPIPPAECAVPEHDSISPQEKQIHPPSQFSTEASSEVKTPNQSMSNAEVGQGHLPISLMLPPHMNSMAPNQHFLPPEGETSLSLDASDQTSDFESERTNPKPKNKLPRPRNPLIDAVAAHDKSKLRKVTERVVPQTAPKTDERDSLLEQIRTKSFNLKPTVATRPSIQGPKTNLKLAAILEKANAIRQALAGSDEDDDADSWSE